MNYRYGRLFALVVAFLVASLFLFSCNGNETPQPTPTTSEPTAEPVPTATATKKPPVTFEFLAGADYGATDFTNATFNSMAAQQADFVLVVGDLSYSQLEPESAWCDYVKSYLGAQYPVEVLVGNHEDDDGPDGWIDNFASCLPDRLGAVGEYAKQYYFDYPADTPIARFIMISPDLHVDGETYRFTKGSPRYTWLADTIDAARAEGIPWVILGMHKLCLTIGEKSCEIGTDLHDLVIEKKVDIVLHGHEHNYERTKQLALSDACQSVPPFVFNPSCVANDTASGVVAKGEGTVFLVVGNAGRTNYDLTPDSPIAGYFAAWAGDVDDQKNGYVKFTVSDDFLVANYIATVGLFSDSLIIQAQGGAPAPIPTAVPTDIPTVETSPTPTVGETETIVIPVIADATIREDRPDRNYGLEPSLEVDREARKDFLLKFDVSGLSGRRVVASRIMLFNLDDSGAGGDFHSTESDWEEETVIWDNAPASITWLSAIGPVTAGNWYEAFLGDHIAVDGIYSFRVSTTSTNGADYASREDPEHAPYLEIILEKPTSSSQVNTIASVAPNPLSVSTSATNLSSFSDLRLSLQRLLNWMMLGLPLWI